MLSRVDRVVRFRHSFLPITLLFVGVPVAAQETDAGMPMILEVSINGTRSHELLSVLRFADGGMSARAAELRELRLKLDPGLSSDTMVRIDKLEGVTARYDEPNQALELLVSDSLLEPYMVDLGGRSKQVDLDNIQTIPAAFLNYGLYHTREPAGSRLAGNAEMLLTGRAGVLSTTGVYSQARAVASYNRFLRLDSSWRYIDPLTVRSYTLGDFASNALPWTSSVRLGGVQWASAFDQRSDIVTTALPQFSGSAALPSTLDLYVNQQRIYSGRLPSGPFDLRSLPVISGNEVTLVMTDATGQQTTTTQAYYYSADLLRPGLKQFSVDVGMPRLSYGVKSNDYDDSLFASGSMRYGLSNAATVEGHAEGSSDGLRNLGAGLIHSLGSHGKIYGSVSASRYQGYSGMRVKLGLDGKLGGVRLYASTIRSFRDYFDLARVSTFRHIRRNDRSNADLGPALSRIEQAKIIDRVGMGVTPFERTSINLNYTRVSHPNEQVRTASLSLSRALSKRISLLVNAYSDLDRAGRYGVYLTFNISLGNVNASAQFNRDSGRDSYTQQLSGTAGPRNGDIGWGLSNSVVKDGGELRNAYISYRAPQALLRARVAQHGGSMRTELQAQGSVLVAGGGVFAANRIGNAYAIVTGAGPDVEVLQGGVRMGRSDRNGRMLLPNLRPYYDQRIYIDPVTLPDGWEPEATERIVVAGYRQGVIVDFGAKAAHGAVLILNDKNGERLPPGHTVELEGGEGGVVGYDGQVYLRGLTNHNRIIVDLGHAGSCAASFAYDANGPVQPTIGPVTCQ